LIADNVRQLADEAIGAAGHIDARLGRLGEQLGVLAEHGGEARGHAEAAEDATGSIGRVLDSFGTAMTGVEQQVSAIAHVATRSTRQIEEFMTGLTGLVNSVEVSSGELDTARTRVYSLLDVSETLIGGIASMGAVTPNTAFITAAQEAAAEISRLFEAAVASGTMRLEDLFDQDYRTVAGSNPVQHMTRFTTFTDRVLPAVQEPLLAIDDRVTFAAAVDRNGYLPTHNRKFSQPQGRDPVWNTAHSRNRRIFDDRTGLTAGRNTKPFPPADLSPGHGRWQLRAHEGRLRTDHRRRPALGRPASGLSRAVSRWNAGEDQDQPTAW
jgi:methyl-accepting chemotaxis protein